MTWKFERVAGPYKGMTGGVVWDGTRILFSAVQEECILKFDPQTGGIEGLCLDSGGNIMASGGWKKNGAGPLVYVFAPTGSVLETHPAPCDLPMRCAFGDADLGSLYLTGGDGCLYRAQGGGRRGYGHA